MDTNYQFEIYTSVSQLPSGWDILAARNIFLTSEYLQVLETSAPANMRCHFIGLFQNGSLAGIVLSQFIDLSDVESFGERDNCFKTKIRKFFFKRFSANVLFVGNNMLTGQNAFAFGDTLPTADGLVQIHKALTEIGRNLAKDGIKVHMTIFKDFSEKQLSEMRVPEFGNYFQFRTAQPNMVFDIRENWLTSDNYVEALLKKYRDQYKRARKKSDDLTKRKLHEDEIIQLNDRIYELYFMVAKNAMFNTFYLPKNHFITLKHVLKDKFLFYGYFSGNDLVGFNTLIKNGKDIDTYFLGYDETCQREKMLYLNMLYDMIGYSINKGFNRIIFARTALEIKSSVGAKPIPMYGFIKHANPIFNAFMPRLFQYFEPELAWQERSPFKD